MNNAFIQQKQCPFFRNDKETIMNFKWKKEQKTKFTLEQHVHTFLFVKVFFWKRYAPPPSSSSPLLCGTTIPVQVPYLVLIPVPGTCLDGSTVPGSNLYWYPSWSVPVPVPGIIPYRTSTEGTVFG